VTLAQGCRSILAHVQKSSFFSLTLPFSGYQKGLSAEFWKVMALGGHQKGLSAEFWKVMALRER
jgi:hypothetical protein